MYNVTPTVSLIELVWTTLSLVGLSTMVWTALDNRVSLQALRQARQNGASALIASIGFWDGIAGVLFHILFLILGVISMGLPPAPADRQLASLIYGVIFIGFQAAILGIQIRNQFARMRTRRIGAY